MLPDRRTRRFPATPAAAFVLLLMSWAAAPAQTDDRRLVAEGRALLAKHCSRCHQIGPTGASALPIAPPFRELMQRYEPEDLEEALAEGLASGHPAMPEFVFQPDEVAAIVAYFATLRAR